MMLIDQDRLLKTLLELLRVPSPSGHEEEVARLVAARLARLGLDVAEDQAGNLLAILEGEGEPLLLTAHLDTVTPADGVSPLLRDGVIRSDGSTVLGADDKSGVAIILEVLEALKEVEEKHRPIEALFTVREEVGLEGAKAFDMDRLRARMGIGLDAGGDQGTIIVRAPAQNSLEVTVHGRMAHAGVNPEQGINAIRVAAEAIADMPLGRIDEETTANIGVISGGRATNIIPDLVTVRGEARSHDETTLESQTHAMVAAFERAARRHEARVDVGVHRKYAAFALSEDSDIVRLVSGRMRALGVEPLLMATGGGSDANVLNAGGVQTVQMSTGMADVHTCDEHIAVADVVRAAQIVLACALEGC